MSDRFPSISPDGLRIAASALPRGNRAVQYVGDASGLWRPEVVQADASGGVWQTTTDLLFVRNEPGDPEDGAILRWDGLLVTVFQPPGLEGWSCHNGLFASWRRDDRLKSRTCSRGGHMAGTVDLGRDVVLEVDGGEIDRGAIAEPRYTGEALVWVKWVDGVRRIFGRRHHGAATDPLSVFHDDEFWPLAVETPRGLYLLTHGHPERGRPLFLRPWGQTKGHIVAHGITDRPDAVAVDGGVLVAYSNLVALQRVVMDLAAPLVDLGGPIVVPPVTPDPPKENPVQLESTHVAVIDAYVKKFGLPRTIGGSSPSSADIEWNKERGREWIYNLIATLTFHFPNDGFVRKRGDRGRPWSNESVARRVGGKLWGWDLLINAGVEWQTFNLGHAEDLAGQDWEAVPAKDHLAGGSTPNPGTPPVTPPPAARPFPAARWPEDVFLHALTRYINEGLYARDKFDEGGGTFTASRGALMWFVPIATEELIADIGANGNTAPTPTRWWALADRVAAKAIDFYRRTAPPE